MKTPVVIMAGGKGTRLKPLTEIIPKPLVKINNTAILKLIIDTYYKHEFTNVFVSVNYMADAVKKFLEGQDISVNYIEEENEMGTVGCLSKIAEVSKHCKDIFIHNCDILINAGYDEILGWHRKHKNDMTIVTCNVITSSAYGEVQKNSHGNVVAISEKPDHVRESVTGMYVLDSQLLKDIPDDFYDMPDLIKSILDRYGKIGTFCVPNDAWIDVGQWDKYEDFVGTVLVERCKNCGSKEVYPAGDRHLCTQCETLM